MSESSRETIRVLHVDDDPGFVDLTATFLERTDDRFTVETATDVDEGLERLGDRRPDCIVSDYEMPGRDGLDFLQVVREEHPDLPFVLFTGRGSEAVASEAVSAGVTDYLQKRTGSEQYELLANRITNAVTQFRTEQRVQTQREQLERLHAATRSLITAETRSEVAVVARDTARDVLDLPLHGFHLYDPDRDALVPEAVTDRVHEVLGDPPAIGPGEGVAWAAYESGEARVYGDIREAPEVMNPDTPIRSELHVPLGEHGVLVAASVRPDDFTEADVTSAKILSANVEAALDRIERNRELERRTDLFRKAQALADVGAWEWYPQREEGYYSEQVYEIYGVDSRSGKSPAADLEAFYHPEDRETLREAFRQAVQDGEPYDLEVRVVDADNTRKWVRTRGDPQFEDGECVRVRGTIQDVTDRREREQRLRRLHDVTLDLARAGSDRAVAELAVEGAEEVLGFPLVTVRRYDGDQGGLAPVAASESVEEVFDDRPVFRPGDGSFNWEVYETGEDTVLDDVSLSSRAVDADTPLRSLAIFSLGEHGTLAAGSVEPATFEETDVFLGRILAMATEAAFERTDNRERLQRQRDDLERKNSRLEAFTDTVSHDLRSPLVVAEGQLELAREKRESEHLTAALEAVQRSQTLVDDLLALARTDDPTTEVEPVGLDDAAGECWQRVDTGSATVEIDTDRTILADRSRLQQLLANLYRNAVEHGSTSPGSPTRQDAVEHGSTSPGSHTRQDAFEHADGNVTVTVGKLEDGFYVEDDGCGIPEAAREDVFDAGYSTSGGTGLGLRIVEEIATAHDWSLRVTDGADGGARFEITGVTAAGQ